MLKPSVDEISLSTANEFTIQLIFELAERYSITLEKVFEIFSENVISEYGADFGNKKGERVDYCLRRKDGTLGWCWIYYTGQGAGDQESYAVYMKEDSPRKGEVFHLGDYLPGGDFFVGANNKEHGIADDRELQRKYDNGELGDGITITENGDIIIE